MQKRMLLTIVALGLMLTFGGPAMADYIYADNLASYNEMGNGLTTWVNGYTSATNPAGLEAAVTGEPDYVPTPQSGEALGWKQGYGNFVLDFGSLISAADVDVTFWHFGGVSQGTANNLVYFSVSTDGTNWSINEQLQDVASGGNNLFETTYDLFDTFGMNEIQYLRVEKISGGPQTGKFIDAVGVNAVPVPGAVWLMGSVLLGLVGLKRRK